MNIGNFLLFDFFIFWDYNIDMRTSDNIQFGSAVPRARSKSLLRYLRATKGFGIDRVAEMAGTTVQAIELIEEGHGSFTFDQLTQIELATNMPLPLLIVLATSDDQLSPSLLPFYKRVRDAIDSQKTRRKISDGDVTVSV